MHGIYELKESLCSELEEYGEKGKLDVGTLQVVDMLAHTIKNLDKIIENYDEYSGDGRSYDGRSYEGRSNDGRQGSRSYDGGSMRGRSYARRRRGADGRYSRDSQMMVEELRELMDDAPDEKTRQEIQKLVSKLENM